MFSRAELKLLKIGTREIRGKFYILHNWTIIPRNTQS